jgi:hypothetical protein
MVDLGICVADEGNMRMCILNAMTRLTSSVPSKEKRIS